MADEKVKIRELTETTSIDNTDFVPVDSASNGTKKYLLSRIAAQASAETTAAVEAEEAARQAADSALDGKIGTLSNLITTAKGSAVAAINEVDANADAAQGAADANAGKIGTLSSLTTDAKTDLVSAVNEVDAHAGANTSALSGKVDKVAGKGLSKNDFTDALKTKLDGIETGAEVNDVKSVAGKTGDVTLGGGDVSYNEETTYAAGTVGKAVTDLKSDLTNITGNGIIAFTDIGKYINLKSTVTMNNGVPVPTGTSATYTYAAVPCQPGDKFTINGTGGNDPLLWGFVSSEGVVLTKSGNSATANNKVITAPENAVYLIIHNQTANLKTSYIGKLLDYRVDDLENDVSSFVVDYNDLTWQLGAIGVNNGADANSTTRARSVGYIPFDKKAIVSIASGIKFSIHVYSDKTASSWVWSDGYWETDSGKTVGEIVSKYTTITSSFKFVRFVIAYSDDSTISNVPLIGQDFKYKATVNFQGVSDLVEDDAIKIRQSAIGNCAIRCAKELSFTDGTHPLIEWFLLEEPGTGRFYYSKDLMSKKYLFTFPYKSYRYSFGILNNGDIIAVLDADAISSSLGKHDSNRENPYVMLASENWSIIHEVNFGSSLKPCGWLSNCGFKVLANGDAIFCEYTRQTTETSNVWKLSGDPTDSTNWVNTKQFPITSTDNETNFKHCHMVMQDFYTGICYLSTGDDSVGAMMWYSDDNGSTWTQLRSPDSTGDQDSHGWYAGSQMYCRMLTLAFTDDYIYWATDAYINDIHYLFRCERDTDGVLDYSTITLLTHIPYQNGAATYGIAMIPELNSILLLDRTDTSETSMPVRMITLDDAELHTIGYLYVNPTQNSAQHLGFRTRFSEWYPTDKKIRFGFGLNINNYNDDINHNKGYGNQGHRESYGRRNINNLIVRVFNDGTGYGFTLDTYDI